MKRKTHIIKSLFGLFSPVDGLKDAPFEGRPIPNMLDWEIRTRIAELGFYLDDEISIIGVTQLEGMRVQFTENNIYIDRRCLHQSFLRADTLLYDFPFSAVFKPICKMFSSGPKANDLAAHSLTLESLFFESTYPSGRLWQKRDWESLRELAEYSIRDLMELVVGTNPEWGNKPTIKEALDVISKCRSWINEPSPSSIPVKPISTKTISHTLPQLASQWFRDRFGWSDSEGSLLPLQVLAVGSGATTTHLDRDVMVTAPTSAGKTFVAELRMLARWSRKDNPRRKTVFLVPTKEIGTERAEELRIGYGYDHGSHSRNRLRVLYSDGDNGFDDYNIANGDFDLAIMVYEKFQYFQQSSGFFSGLGEVVVDELEMIGKEGRGQNLELVITAIITSHKDIVVSLLSRPFSNSDDLLNLLKRPEGYAQDNNTPLNLVVTRRPLPIKIGVWEPRSKVITYSDCNDFSITEEPIDLPYPGKIVETLKELLLFFLAQTDDERTKNQRNNIVIASPTKRDNLYIAEHIKKLYDTDNEVKSVIDANANTGLIESRMKALEPTQRQKILSELVPKGIAIHDADLSPEERQFVSRSFRDRETCILIASQTMAYGVNLPAQTIVFLGWGTRPPSSGMDTQHGQYVEGLQEDFVTWLGRVGRYGQRNHRTARAIYLCGGNEGSNEYNRIKTRIAYPNSPIMPLLGADLADSHTALYGLKSISQIVGGGATFGEYESFYKAIYNNGMHPTAYALMGLMDAGNLILSEDFSKFNTLIKMSKWPDKFFLESIVDRLSTKIPKWRNKLLTAFLQATVDTANHNQDGLTILRRYADFPGFRALFLEPDPSCPDPAISIARIDRGLIFENTRLGNIALGFGVSIETVKMLHGWINRWADGKTTWSLFDIFALIRHTEDGSQIPSLRIGKSHNEIVRKMFEARMENLYNLMGDTWESRSPLLTLDLPTGLQATFLALEDWCKGAKLFIPDPNPTTPNDIEMTYGLLPYSSNVGYRAKDYGRIMRVMGALIQLLPKSGEEADITEPENPLKLSSTITLPEDFSDVSDSLSTGMPPRAADLGKIGIEGLSRAWALDLFERMESQGYELDLPVVERLRLFSHEVGFFECLPTPGLGQRIKNNLESKPRAPLSESLRNEPDQIKDFYANPVVRHAQVLQGLGRYTALRVCHRSAYSVIRRNLSKDKPIKIERNAHYDEWVSNGAVEFLSEVGYMADRNYVVDRFLVDLDPKNGFEFKDLRNLALEIGNRLDNHNFVENVYFHWTGGKGFHIIGEFKDGIRQDAEQVKRQLKSLTHRLSNDLTIFEEDQPHLTEPFVILDLKPMMKRGLYRNGLSLHSNVGDVCVPVAKENLQTFNPLTDATIESVLANLTHERQNYLVEAETYWEFVKMWSLRK
jgi:hypothetical protein